MFTKRLNDVRVINGYSNTCNIILADIVRLQDGTFRRDYLGDEQWSKQTDNS